MRVWNRILGAHFEACIHGESRQSGLQSYVIEFIVKFQYGPAAFLYNRTKVKRIRQSSAYALCMPTQHLLGLF